MREDRNLLHRSLRRLEWDHVALSANEETHQHVWEWALATDQLVVREIETSAVHQRLQVRWMTAEIGLRCGVVDSRLHQQLRRSRLSVVREGHPREVIVKLRRLAIGELAQRPRLVREQPTMRDMHAD